MQIAKRHISFLVKYKKSKINEGARAVVQVNKRETILTKAQVFTFLVREQRHGANMGSTQGPTSLGK